MRRSRIALLLVIVVLPLAGCRRSAKPAIRLPSPKGPEVARLRSVIETVRPLYPLLGPAASQPAIEGLDESSGDFDELKPQRVRGRLRSICTL